MVAAREHLPKLTPEEYFKWEEQQEVKHEYFDGEVYAMTGGDLNHSQIASKFAQLLENHLEDSGCRVFNSDAKVKIENANKYVYPDASVTCDERDSAEPTLRERDAAKFISYPCPIVEVLSPSTEAYNRGKKFKLYQRFSTGEATPTSSLIDYVLVDADEMGIEVFRKNDRDRWEVINYVAGDTVELESINLTFPIERVYRGIKF